MFVQNTINVKEFRIHLGYGDVSVTGNKHYSFLISSALPNDYSPIDRTVIGALYRQGINVHQLSINKYKDERPILNCWSSNVIQGGNANYRRVLIFEPPDSESVIKRIANIFFFLGKHHWSELEHVVCPLLSSGNRNVMPKDILRIITESCILSMHYGLPLKTFSIIFYGKSIPSGLIDCFTEIKDSYENHAGIQQYVPYQIICRETDGPMFQSVNVEYYTVVKISDGESVNNIKDDVVCLPFNLLNFLTSSELIILFDHNDFTNQRVCKLAAIMTYFQQRATQSSLVVLTYPENSSSFSSLLSVEEFPGLDVKILDEESEALAFTLSLVCPLVPPRPVEEDPFDPFGLVGYSISEQISLKHHFVNMKLRHLIKNNPPDITILCDVTSTHDNQVADALATKLRARDFLVYKRRSLEAEHQELKLVVSMIHRSSIVIAVMSESFINNKCCIMEYSMAQSCHASAFYPTVLLSLIASADLESKFEGCPPIFKREHVLNIVVSEPELLNEDAIKFFCEYGFSRDTEHNFASIDPSCLRINQLSEKSRVSSNHINDYNDRTRPCDNFQVHTIVLLYHEADEKFVHLLEKAIHSDIKPSYIIHVTQPNDLPVLPADRYLIVLVLSQDNFFHLSDSVSVDLIYHVIRLTVTSSQPVLIRCILLDCLFTNVPLFIKRLPMITRLEGESDQLLCLRGINWMRDNCIHESIHTIFEPMDSEYFNENAINKDNWVLKIDSKEMIG